MSELQFGAHTLDAAYRQSIPPFYTAEEVISTFLGHNKDHPSQEEWMELQADLSTSDSSGSDSDWKNDDSDGSDESSDYSCGSDDALTAESSDVPDPESADSSDSESSDGSESESSDVNC